MRAKNARENIIRGIYAYKPTGKNTQADDVAAVMREICEHHTDLFKQFTKHNSNEVLDPILKAVNVKMDHQPTVTSYVFDLLSLMKVGDKYHSGSTDQDKEISKTLFGNDSRTKLLEAPPTPTGQDSLYVNVAELAESPIPSATAATKVSVIESLCEEDSKTNNQRYAKLLEDDYTFSDL